MATVPQEVANNNAIVAQTCDNASPSCNVSPEMTAKLSNTSASKLPPVKKALSPYKNANAVHSPVKIS